jgi:hypothetical protein
MRYNYLENTKITGCDQSPTYTYRRYRFIFRSCTTSLPTQYHVGTQYSHYLRTCFLPVPYDFSHPEGIQNRTWPHGTQPRHVSYGSPDMGHIARRVMAAQTRVIWPDTGYMAAQTRVIWQPRHGSYGQTRVIWQPRHGLYGSPDMGHMPRHGSYGSPDMGHMARHGLYGSPDTGYMAAQTWVIWPGTGHMARHNKPLSCFLRHWAVSCKGRWLPHETYSMVATRGAIISLCLGHVWTAWFYRFNIKLGLEPLIKLDVIIYISTPCLF